MVVCTRPGNISLRWTVWGYVHTYTFSKRSVFEKIRFGVSTRIVRQSGDPVHTDVDWSNRKRASTWKWWPLCTDSSRAQIALFLFVSFACQCCSSVLLHVRVPRGRSVRSLRIMEAGDTRKAPKAKWSTNKRRSKMKQKQNTLPSSKPWRRRGRVASEDNSNHPPFCFRRQLLRNKKKWAATGFGNLCTLDDNVFRVTSKWVRVGHTFGSMRAWQPKCGCSETALLLAKTFI